MSITIYQLPISPYCISVTQALKALRIPFKIVNVSNVTRREILQASRGKYYQVPLLKDGSRIVGESGSDSQDIARYIDRQAGDRRLFPTALEGLQGILNRHIEDNIEAISFRLVDPFYVASVKDIQARTMMIRHNERKFGIGCIMEWKKNRKELQKRVDAYLSDFEKILRHSDFIFGDEPVYTDFLLYGIIGNFTFNGWNKLNPKFKALTRWYKELRSFRY
ncbi:MAG: glutathione S-transferase family protein [Chthoniobacterales bacterium]